MFIVHKVYRGHYMFWDVNDMAKITHYGSTMWWLHYCYIYNFACSAFLCINSFYIMWADNLLASTNHCIDENIWLMKMWNKNPTNALFSIQTFWNHSCLQNFSLHKPTHTQFSMHSIYVHQIILRSYFMWHCMYILFHNIE